MKTYKLVDAKVREHLSTTCDKCGKIGKSEDPDLDWQEWFNIHFTGGYDSIFGDGNEYNLDLCQECGKELFRPYLQTCPKKDPIIERRLKEC